jgi:hypothetical protein
MEKAIWNLPGLIPFMASDEKRRILHWIIKLHCCWFFHFQFCLGSCYQPLTYHFWNVTRQSASSLIASLLQQKVFTLSSSLPEWSLTMQRFSVHICSWSPSWRMIWSWDPAEYDPSFHKAAISNKELRVSDQYLRSLEVCKTSEIWLRAKIRILALRIRTRTPKVRVTPGTVDYRGQCESI